MEPLVFFLLIVGALCLKKQQEEPQPPTDRKPGEFVINPPPPPDKNAVVQENAKQSLVLVLVISASQAEFLESLKNKKDIDVSEGEQLYQITRYLWLGTETKLSENRPDINEYSVAKGAESEYDIYLVYIQLKKADKGFNSNVNQLDRFDAFRKLADLPVNFTISDRLQMEAYGNIEVYNR
ncbi:hypothetical protein C7B69_11200 [filamentous cyanobacterium Phorm 46]|nr:hypothetical protein C7B69_11200 [filamentous cyanobacterium Phorm 46]